MASAQPKVGHRYSCAEQSKMHGGDARSTLPDKDGRVTLIRFRLDRNPNGPEIIDHGPPSSGGSRTPERVEMLRRQSEPLPVYKYIQGSYWEYVGRYRVQDVKEGGPEAAERSKIRGRPTRYVIRLDRAD